MISSFHTIWIFCFQQRLWIKVGESFPFSELLPPGCTYLSSRRATGRDGELASMFRSGHNCQQVTPGSLGSFEIQTFALNCKMSVLCARVYRPPKIHKYLLHEFSDLLTGLVLKYNHFVIVRDFNIYVCCEEKPLAKDFDKLV